MSATRYRVVRINTRRGSWIVDCINHPSEVYSWATMHAPARADYGDVELRLLDGDRCIQRWMWATVTVEHGAIPIETAGLVEIAPDVPGRFEN